MTEKDERLFACLIYMFSFFGVLIGAFLVWFLKRRESEYVNNHGKNYFNFLITYSIYTLVTFILIGVNPPIFLILLLTLAALILFFHIRAAIHAFKGLDYQVPLSIHIFKTTTK
ncbi:DUF4870 domain-containing protein [Salipaludibacillus sp. LMS25]|jgi:uncharacterized Tic20 family protein|uniref:DUF4870 domain-containing protein n=1 Tax=Salipaludibacillus sp. LMS25 TaxID=2924031 RepID=UPI0020D047C4|nr:DUF4870 domain-containing protein [Salipaludibacillus sp. LMS25]UTR15313.1 DUF4870 domain-containing protein [Salipaludibacillus sp. LMS25]